MASVTSGTITAGVQFTGSGAGLTTIRRASLVQDTVNSVVINATGSDPVPGALAAQAPLGVPLGGTGAASFTSYAPITANTTTTGALHSIALGAAGTVLTAAGAASYPSFQSPPAGFSQVVVKRFPPTASPYTPTAGMKYCIVEIVGGGGGGGGAQELSGNQAVGGGGGAGGYARALCSAATIGASKAVVIGSGGAGRTGNTKGDDGGQSTFGGTMIVAGGGIGGSGMAGSSTAFYTTAGGAGGSVSATIPVASQPGANGGTGISCWSIVASLYCVVGGYGAGSPLGLGGSGANARSGGAAGVGYGSGGGGAGASGKTTEPPFTDRTGGNGTAGVCIITEFI